MFTYLSNINACDRWQHHIHFFLETLNLISECFGITLFEQSSRQLCKKVCM